MADNIPVTPGTGKTVATDEVTDGTLGTVQVQFVKLMDGTLDGTTKAKVGSQGLQVQPGDQYSNYETVAASQTAQALGPTGATGDYLSYVTVFPGTAGCGLVTILDNATVWGTFPGGGTTPLPSLVPFTICVGAFSVSGAWKITTGANVTCAGVGLFT